MFRFDTLRDDTASTWKIVGILCILCLILLSTRQYFACWYIPVFASNTRSIVFQDFTLLAVFQCFPLCEVLRVQYYSEYFTRVCCSISRFDTLAILSTRSSWPSVVVVLLIYSQYSLYYGSSITPILSVLASRNKCTRYSERTLNFCCDAGCCSCCSCCCCLSGSSTVDVPPSLAA